MFNVVAAVSAGFIYLAGVAIVGAIPVYYLYNWLMPELYEMGRITFFQAIGLMFLCGLLFKSPSASTE